MRNILITITADDGGHDYSYQFDTVQSKTYLVACAFEKCSPLTIRSAVIGDPTVFKFHIGISEGAMLGDTPSHPHSPHAE